MRRTATLLLWLAAAPATAQEPYDRDPAECAQMSTEDVEVVPYVVQRGDSCARIARRQYGDRSRYDLIHAYNPSMGPEPHRHAEGTHLCLPREAPPRDSGPAARVTALRHDVRAREPETPDWVPAAMGQEIDRGTRVNTLARAFAELTFRDTTIVTLRGDTLVVVYGATSGAVRRTATEAVLETGALRTRLGALRAGHRLQVRTPSSRVELNGGSAVASVDDSSTTRVSNHEGGAARVADANGRGSVQVQPGMGSMVQSGSRPSPPRPLPDAPSWSPGQPPRFVGVAEMTTVRGAWAPVTGARVYRVEIALRPDGRDLVAQVEVPAEVTRFEIHRIPPGTYYTRVSTLDGDFFESRPSEPYAFEVILGALQPPGMERNDEPPQWDPGDASEEPQPVVVLAGTRLHAPDGVQCGMGDGELTSSVRLDAPGEVSLRCQSAGAPLGTFAVTVAQVTLSSAEAGASLTATRGTEQALELRLRSSADLPSDVELTGSEGVDVLGFERRGARLTARVRVSEDAPEPAQLRLATSDGHALGATELRLADARSAADASAGPTAAEPEEPSDFEPLWSQAFATTLQASLVGVRDLRREPVGVWFSAAYFSEPIDGGEERLRGTAGIQAALFDRQLHLDLATAGDPIGVYDRRSQRGAGDLWGAAGFAPALDEDLDLMFEVGAFFPTQQGGPGLGVVRLVPSVHASLLVEERFLFRTRQGAFVDLDDSENAAWVSAYAFDARLLDPLSVGAELDVAIGQEGDQLIAMPTLGLNLSLYPGPFVIGLGTRFGLTEEAQEAYGFYSVFATLEAGLWNVLE